MSVQLPSDVEITESIESLEDVGKYGIMTEPLARVIRIAWWTINGRARLNISHL